MNADGFPVSADQFGNYLIQWILLNTEGELHESVAAHIRYVFPSLWSSTAAVRLTTGDSKHMVSLRGSKYGSRVAMLACNQTSLTRPNVPATMPPPRLYSSNGYGSNNGYGGGYGNNSYGMGYGNGYGNTHSTGCGQASGRYGPPR
jgi:hypothetical protein